MLEQVLQDKIVELVKANELLEFIVGKESVLDPLLIDEDDHYMPDFFIDSLLRRRYAESAGRVIKCLENYELITGESIRSISLQTGEILKPDLVLFNPIANQIIIIENKMNKMAEREAVTELLGFANEVRNHLPFISNLDIHYILIAPDFKTLLDHSVSSQLLGGHINILCLKPIVVTDEITGLEIHFPKAWTDLGQGGLAPEALVSYTMCLYLKDIESDGEVNNDESYTQKADGKMESGENEEVNGKYERSDDLESLNFEMQRAITMAADMISHDGDTFHSNGFCLVWVNGFDKFADNALAAISIYVLNPFTFLPEATKRGFTIRENPLQEYLSNRHELNGGNMFPASLFTIAEKAERYLKKYFYVSWERASNWVQDLADSQYGMQRYPVVFNSFGIIGDFIRYYYLHPAVQRFWLTESERKSIGYNYPIVGTQFINLIAGNVLFKDGNFSPKDVFLFGKYLGLHYQAQQNGHAHKDSASRVYDASLFWTALPVIQGLKEIQMRLYDAKDIEADRQIAFAVAINQESIQDDFKERFEAFCTWFGVMFLDRENQQIFSELFDLGIKFGSYFDRYLRPLYPKLHLPELKKNLIDFSKYVLGGIAMELIEDNLIDPRLRTRVSIVYFADKLMDLSSDKVDEYLRNGVADDIFLENFEGELLEILDQVTGNLIHQLNNYEFLDSLDWQWMYDTAQNRFREGRRHTAILVSANGQVSLGQIEEGLGFVVSDPSDILIHGEFYASGIAVIIKVKWEELRNRTFKFANLGKEV